jgi:Tfp pilus assembly protein PilV
MRNGFSMLEALIAIFVLAMGSVGLMRAVSSHMDSHLNLAEENQAAAIASTLNQFILAHAQALAPGSPRGAVVAQIQEVSKKIQDEIRVLERIKGYKCNNMRPVATGHSGQSAPVSTWVKSLQMGPPVCVEVRVLNGVAADFNSVWVQTSVHRPSMTMDSGQEIQSVTVPLLIGVFPS